jgi:hypothetical protein
MRIAAGSAAGAAAIASDTIGTRCYGTATAPNQRSSRSTCWLVAHTGLVQPDWGGLQPAVACISR